MKIALGIILIVASLFLIVAVLMQSSKSHRLSGTIAGGAETFFGKTKGSTIDKKLSKITTVVAIIFVVLVLVVYLLQDNGVANGGNSIDLSGITTGDVEHDHDHDHEETGDPAESDDATETGDPAETDAGAEA